MNIVNTQTIGHQRMGAVTSLDGGGYVVAWRGPAYSGEAIWFQRYDAAGNKVGAETWAKDVDPGGTEVPRLIGLEGGRFMVNDRLYDAAGIPIAGIQPGAPSPAFRYAHTPEGEFLSESDPTIAGLPGGGYVTVEPSQTYASPSLTFTIRWYDESGTQVREHQRALEPAGEFGVPPSSYQAGIIALPDGKVLVTWYEVGRRSERGEFELYSMDGQPLSHAVVAADGVVSQLDATPLPDGGFVVTWVTAGYMDSTPPEAFYQRYDASGEAVGEAVSLGSAATGRDPVRVSAATTLADGDLVLVFEVRAPNGLDVGVHHLQGHHGGGEEPPPPENEGQVINSTGPGSTLTGGAGNDTLNASRGQDVLTGNGGADTFAWAEEPWAPATVTDFALGTDRLDLSALFEAAGYSGSDPIADGRIVLMDRDDDTLVLFDDDGAGGDWPNYIITLEGVESAGLTWAQLAGSDGPEPPPPDAEDVVIDSSGPGDTLTGGEGDDTLNASRGSDVLTGAGGADVFAWAAEPWSPARVTDFTPGVDKLDLRALFDRASYAGSDPFADGYLRLIDDGAGGTKVLFDRDAGGSDPVWPNYIIHLEGVAPGAVGLGDWIVQ